MNRLFLKTRMMFSFVRKTFILFRSIQNQLFFFIRKTFFFSIDLKSIVVDKKEFYKSNFIKKLKFEFFFKSKTTKNVETFVVFVRRIDCHIKDMFNQFDFLLQNLKKTSLTKSICNNFLKLQELYVQFHERRNINHKNF